MPLYEYVCGSCKKTTEMIQRVGAPQLKVCPHCGGKLKKAISAPAIQFKGSGFYITDYARGSAPGSSSGSGSGEGSKGAGEKSDEQNGQIGQVGQVGQVGKGRKIGEGRKESREEGEESLFGLARGPSFFRLRLSATTARDPSGTPETALRDPGA